MTDGKLPERTQELVDQDAPALGGKIDFTFWWVALGYDTVKIIEHAVKTAGSTDPARFQEALENTTDLRGVYATYSWGPKKRNGFPDKQHGGEQRQHLQGRQLRARAALSVDHRSTAGNAACLPSSSPASRSARVYAATALVYNVMFSTSKVLSVTTGHLCMLGGVFGAWFIAGSGPAHRRSAWSARSRSAPPSAGSPKSSAIRRVLARSDEHLWLLSTLALATMVQQAVGLWWGTEPRPFPRLIPQDFRAGIFDQKYLAADRRRHRHGCWGWSSSTAARCAASCS